MKNQEDEFYEELDRKKLHHSCCTTQTMLIFFLVILIGAIGSTIYCYTKLKAINFSSKTILATFQDKNDFYDKLKIQPDQENFEITLTSAELTAITAEGISGKNFLIKNVQVIISKDDVEIFGTLIKPLSAQIKITTLPQAENGKIKFEVLSLKVGHLSMPKFIQNNIEAVLNQAMDQNFQALYETAEVQTIVLFDDKMIIGGKVR